MTPSQLIFAASLMGVGLVSSGSDKDYTQQIQQWRHERIEHLTAADGWLSLVGLHWLQPGRNSIGSAKDNTIVLKKGPAHLGTATWNTDGTVRLQLAKGAKAEIDGGEARSVTLLDDSHDKPTTVSFGTVKFYLVARADKKGLRVKDSQAATRTHFAGIDSFPIDPKWRVHAKWVPFKPAHKMKVPTEIGTVETYPVPGKAVFRHGGRTYELWPVIEAPGDKQLFVIFADRTSGKETYGAARFLYTDMPRDGKLVIDFNKAYNPPCAFTPYATCPLAPPENRLDLRVTAGEKKYRGGEAHK